MRLEGQVIARLPAGTLGVSSIIDSITWLIKWDYELDEVKMEALRENMRLLIDDNVLLDIRRFGDSGKHEVA